MNGKRVHRFLHLLTAVLCMAALVLFGSLHTAAVTEAAVEDYTDSFEETMPYADEDEYEYGDAYEDDDADELNPADEPSFYEDEEADTDSDGSIVPAAPADSPEEDLFDEEDYPSDDPFETESGSESAAEAVAEERFIMIGDSYSVNSANFHVDEAWPTLVEETLGLKGTAFGATSAKAKGGVSGAGFYSPDNTYLMQLKRAQTRTDASKVTAILIGGGIGNDYRTSGGRIGSVYTAMKEFNTYLRANFPRATVYYAGYNWGILSSRQKYCSSWCNYYKQYCAEFGWEYLTGSENALRGYATYFYFNTDNIHPKQSGQYLIANSILRALDPSLPLYEVPEPESYKITYKLNGGTAKGNPTSYEEGFVNDIVLNNPVRKGYIFTGWTGTELETQTVEVILEHQKFPVGDRSYTAHWIEYLGFTDVPLSSFCYDAVAWAVKQVGIASGTTAATFSPDASITRGQFMVMLYRLAGSPAAEADGRFRDVKSTAFYANAVAWAADMGITAGITADTFAPDQNCTRGQIITFLYRYNTLAEEDRTVKVTELTTGFQDVRDDSAFALPIAWGVANGITTGITAELFSPNRTCTRGQAVTFLYRYTHI